ncbi:MAG: hypothetical protein HY706_02495 [Candidatus Hydrogenedentes bacterium]|nr:hypothetical protein [Candidatus Hydrogenedentota bacterium]
MLKIAWLLGIIISTTYPVAAGVSYMFPVLPTEHRQMTDPETGAELTFLTTHPADDQNLYYEQRSWLADSSLILFNSSRPVGGLMGYLTQTGELVRLTTPHGGLSGATAARDRNSVFAVRGAEVIELSVTIKPSNNPTQAPSSAIAKERVIATLPESTGPPNTSLTESCDGKFLAIGVGGRGDNRVRPDGCVLLISVRSGKVAEIFRTPAADFSGHVVFSRTNPRLVSFGNAGSWLTVMDVRKKQVVFTHKNVPGEFCTHHCWWIDDTITFCGGFHPQPTEDADVKVMNIYTGEVRIIGKGSWWPGATPAELARQNWWHACGHENGRWVAADNWHGDIGLFHGKTTRTYILTKGHRTYGHGTHPEVGWDRRGDQVIFASHRLGNVDVCVATIPKAWQIEWEEQLSNDKG